MRILCTGPGTYAGDEPIKGRYYEAVEADTPTEVYYYSGVNYERKN
jgi:hypothetical protein